jgi:arylsulfatase A-like enzyme
MARASFKVALLALLVFCLEQLGWSLAGRPGEILLLLPSMLAACLAAGLAAAGLNAFGAGRWAWLAAWPAAFLSLGHLLDQHLKGAWGFALAIPLGLLLTLALFRVLSWRVGRVLGLLLVACAILPPAARLRVEGPAPPGGAHPPNIILLVMDTTRRDHLTLYGYQRPTSPSLARLGEESEVYDDAWSVAPWTPSSHASMLTGRLPGEHGVDGEDPVAFPPGIPTLPEVLSAAGYVTGGFVSNPNLLPTGWDRGFAQYRPPWFRGRDSIAWLLNRYWLGGDDAWDPLRNLSRRTLGLARIWWRRHSDRPRFLFINLMDPHRPYDPPPDTYAQFLPGVPRPEAMAVEQDPDHYTLKPGLNPREAELLAGLYDGEIAAMDREIGRFVDWLRARGDLEGTIVAVTADHGERLGERGLVGHESIGDRSLDEHLLRVPLLIRLPRAAPSRRIPGRVRLDGLAGHLLRVAGLSVPTALEPRPWGSEEGQVEVAQVQRQAWIARRLVRQGWAPASPLALSDRSLVADGHFALACANVLEGAVHCLLHGLEGDPDWKEDVAADHPEVVARLGAITRSLPRFQGPGAAIDDPELKERLRSLGYVR